LLPNIPNGSNVDWEKVNQAQWYRDYLAQGLTSAAGVANLWIIGESTGFLHRTNPLFSTDFGLSQVVTDQGLNVNPTLTGVANFTFTTGGTATFTGDVLTLNGGCPTVRNYDGGTNAGTAVVTHRYTSGTASGPGAVIMNKSTTLQWSTIWMGFGWFDLRQAWDETPPTDPPASPDGTPDIRFARKILNALLPVACREGEVATDNPGDEVAAPRVTELHQNVPNPFNPVTTIRFDLAEDGQVDLVIYDVGGRRVKQLVRGPMTRGFGRAVTWNGLDAQGVRVPSGIYFYRLTTPDYTATRKMVMLK
jgi:hypothetical protein